VNAREVFELAVELERARTPFALATVVERHAPVSAHLGDRAIVFSDGRMQGFVGGSCSRDEVRRQAVDAMHAGNARLVRIEGSCASEGAVDVYIEPHLPARTLLVAGFTPVAADLARFGAHLEGYRLVRVVEPNEVDEAAEDDGARTLAVPELRGFLAAMDRSGRARLVAVVASLDRYDGAVLAALLESDAPAYVGLVASRKRAEHLFGHLEQQGIARERMAAVRSPAGLDIGAQRPGDVAISILAEIIAVTAAERLREGAQA
jgi:xanthine dehydrogenase accessory factor